MKVLLYLLALTLGGTACTFADNADPVNVSYVDPLQKVLRTDNNFGDGKALAEVARGEYASLQFVVRGNGPIKNLQATVSSLQSGSSRLADVQVRYVGYVQVGSSETRQPAHDRITAPGNSYPDPLLEQDNIDVGANQSQPVWITVAVPADAAPGTYSAQVTFKGQGSSGAFSIQKPFQVKVYPVQVKKTSLLVSFWPAIENPRIGGMAKRMSYMNANRDVSPYGDSYWNLVSVMAKMMKKYHQNVVWMSAIHMADITMDNNGKYTFDFSKFDKMVDIFEKEGTLDRIEGGHLAGRGGWTSGFELMYYININGKLAERSGDYTKPEVVNFYKQYIPALVSHLKQKNWWDKYYQHIGDEPIVENTPSFINTSQFIKSLAPDMKTMDAIQTAKPGSVLDVPVAELDILDHHYDDYQALRKSGKELWSYTAWMPQGEYPNLFIDLPLIKTRALYWMNYKYDLKGYLHWSYNYWGGNPMGETAQKVGGSMFPGGESWVVYPKEDGLLSSIRLEAIRDGIFDYELLKMLKASNPALAGKLSGKLVQSFTQYETDIATFRQLRTQLLTALSQVNSK